MPLSLSSPLLPGHNHPPASTFSPSPGPPRMLTRAAATPDLSPLICGKLEYIFTYRRVVCCLYDFICFMLGAWMCVWMYRHDAGMNKFAPWEILPRCQREHITCFGGDIMTVVARTRWLLLYEYYDTDLILGAWWPL